MKGYYSLIIYIHVLSVILSIGPYFVLFPILTMMRKKQYRLTEEFDTIFRFVIRITKHTGHILIVSGLLLVWLGPWSWKSSWIVLTVLILICSGYFIARAFSPSLKKLRAGLGDPSEHVRRLTQSIWIYLSLMMIMLLLMVAKPMFW